MFEILDKTHDNVIAARIHGRLVHEDYQNLVPKLEELIAQYGCLRCYCEMTDFEGITASALWDEIKFDTKHCRDIERCAVVGDRFSHEWMTKVSKVIFPKAQIKYFDITEADKAWEWVNEESIGCGCASEKHQTVGD